MPFHSNLQHKASRAVSWEFLAHARNTLRKPEHHSVKVTGPGHVHMCPALSLHQSNLKTYISQSYLCSLCCKAKQTTSFVFSSPCWDITLGPCTWVKQGSDHYLPILGAEGFVTCWWFDLMLEYMVEKHKRTRGISRGQLSEWLWCCPMEFVNNSCWYQKNSRLS